MSSSTTTTARCTSSPSSWRLASAQTLSLYTSTPGRRVARCTRSRPTPAVCTSPSTAPRSRASTPPSLLSCRLSQRASPRSCPSTRLPSLPPLSCRSTTCSSFHTPPALSSSTTFTWGTRGGSAASATARQPGASGRRPLGLTPLRRARRTPFTAAAATPRGKRTSPSRSRCTRSLPSGAPRASRRGSLWRRSWGAWARSSASCTTATPPSSAARAPTLPSTRSPSPAASSSSSWATLHS
mmetsp:Transcript_17841/g.45009  ORF Transcript_17841/g.45009 Transcript_17841/m.45009 type:complete len:240 (-) Transcript_17841:1455-2174(-)